MPRFADDSPTLCMAKLATTALNEPSPRRNASTGRVLSTWEFPLGGRRSTDRPPTMVSEKDMPTSSMLAAAASAPATTAPTRKSM